MRKRSESFYIKNREDKSPIDSNKIRTERRKRSKISVLLEDEDNIDKLQNYEETFKELSHDDFDELGVNKTFQIQCRVNRPEEDESDLICNLEEINRSFKLKDKSLFLDNISKVCGRILHNKTVSNKSKQIGKDDLILHNISPDRNKKIPRSLTLDTLNCLNFDLNWIRSHENVSTDCESTTHNSKNSNWLNNIIAQNINIVDDVIKLIVIGKEKVGKSLFIKTVLSDNVEMKDSSYSYTHTSSFEIKKKNIKLLGKHIRLELWDTNNQIVQSEIFQVYEKICDGFVFIIDPLDKESVLFVLQQVEKIIKNAKNPNFYLIANVKFANNEEQDMGKITKMKTKFNETDYWIKKLSNKHDIKITYIDVTDYKLLRSSLNKFLCLTLIKKSLLEKKNVGKNKGTTNRRSCNFSTEDL